MVSVKSEWRLVLHSEGDEAAECASYREEAIKQGESECALKARVEFRDWRIG